MSDAEIAACRAPNNDAALTSAKKIPSAAASKPDEKTRYQHDVERENARFAQQKAIDAAPLEPRIGMTLAEAEQMSQSNDQRERSYQKSHPIGSSSDGWDRRWGLWSGCRRNVTKTAGHERQQWVCGDRSERHYLYFDDGVLTAIQGPSY